MNTTAAAKPQAMCTMHSERVAVARMSYIFAGCTRKSHYNVCFSCYAEYGRENMVAIKFYESES